MSLKVTLTLLNLRFFPVLMINWAPLRPSFKLINSLFWNVVSAFASNLQEVLNLSSKAKDNLLVTPSALLPSTKSLVIFKLAEGSLGGLRARLLWSILVVNKRIFLITGAGITLYYNIIYVTYS